MSLLSIAEADAIAARFKPSNRAGITAGDVLTLEAHREIAATRTRPVTDTVRHEGIRVIGGAVRVLNDVATDAEINAAKAKLNAERRRDKERQRHRDRRFAKAHHDAMNRALGVVVDMTYMHGRRRDAYAESLRLRAVTW